MLSKGEGREEEALVISFLCSPPPIQFTAAVFLEAAPTRDPLQITATRPQLTASPVQIAGRPVLDLVLIALADVVSAGARGGSRMGEIPYKGSRICLIRCVI